MEIPQYPASRPLAISDKPLLDRLCNELQPRISELTFAGLFLFRTAHNYRLTSVGNSVVLLGRGYDGSAYFLPPLNGDVKGALQLLFAAGVPLYGADDSFVSRYCSGNSLRITELRDSSDYLYLRDELANLPGSRFHKKKNRISYFTRRHEHIVALYSSEYKDECLALLYRWVKSSGNPVSGSLRLEIDATVEALSSAVELELEGVVILVNDVVAAFALGERLNRETAVCHFEKGDPFSDGLYQLVNREFAKLLFQECQYLNREQDLGEPGLRNAKLSYHPVELVRKYLVTPLK
ncbi:MAG: DUF2156 domain-containing protein [Desulfuromonadaceae bacterium]|nr:DUF2156 domain-containing protein [Desulfuromonadaceae bacterium]MDD2854163.1 DUF2156 domain-containing protein [Desulfuromonadaceae bacterium]